MTFLLAESIGYKHLLLLHVAWTAALRNLLGCITGPAAAQLALWLLQKHCQKRVRAQALEKLKPVAFLKVIKTLSVSYLKSPGVPKCRSGI